MGEAQFPVTTASPEAQAFFNQGAAQLHTFYYFEAERSFRQAALLDPACAMAYWGMAMANPNNSKRAQGFLKKAQEKAAALGEKLTGREKKYLEALSRYHEEGKKEEERRGNYVQGLEAVVLAYPDDLEAKAFLAWAIIGNSWAGDKLNSWVAVNVLIEEVLRRAPMHPGAHHYRIHLWDRHDPEQALRSAQLYAQSAPGIAHAWHMPGHIYNGLSRWKEAVYQQEGSARVDHAHMLEDAILPFQIHNYAHNQHYLIANLSHLGRLRDGVAFSRNLVEVPYDPQLNDKNNGGSAQRLGRFSLMRLYVRYESWDELLSDPHLDWSDVPEEKAWKAYGEGLAHLGKGDRGKAAEEAGRLDAVAAAAAKNPWRDADLIETARLELRGRLALAEGRMLEGFDLMNRGARMQVEKFKEDLAGYPRPFHEALGFAHLEARDWGLAEAHFREVLEHRQNNLVSLAGLVEACGRAGKEKEAAEAYHQFLKAWQEADQDLPYRKRLEQSFPSLAQVSRTSEIAADPAGTAGTAGGEEPAGAKPVDLANLGPKLWEPSPAPDFSLQEAMGKMVRLQDFRGRNVLLAFYLGGACAHCMEQLFALGREKEAFDKLEVQILAASDDPPERSRDLLAGPRGKELPFPMLSDPGREAARRYQAHDGFENLPLHGLFFIDRQGRIRWSRIGADPFTDLGFLKAEVERVNRLSIASTEKK